MARLPRLTVPGYPHHLIQRGNNRQLVFRDEGDYQFMLDLLAEHSARAKVAIHSYVLMGNHFHLLATPGTVEGLPAMMQAIGRRYVQAFNRRHLRTGALWEGRYRATLVQGERYLLACMVYIDLNPVRAGIVANPAQYHWSSYRHYTGACSDRLITPHPIWWQLGNTPFAREAGYADLVNQGVSAEECWALTESVLKGWALGEDQFLGEVQKQTARRLIRGHAGRPYKKGST